MHIMPVMPLSGNKEAWPDGGPTTSAPPTTISGDENNPLRSVCHFTGGGMGNLKKPKSDMVYLLLMPDQVVEEERKFGLVAMWANPFQVHLPSVDEVAKTLALLITTGEDWAYAFVQLNEHSQHIPLSTTRHISAMIDSVPGWSTCGHLSHLEVHKFLQCGGKVVYPEGLNEGLEPLQVSLPRFLIWDLDPLVESTCKPALL